MLVLAGCVGGPGNGDNATAEPDLPEEDVDEPVGDDVDKESTHDETDAVTEGEETDETDEKPPDTTDVDGDLEFHHVDVGQADATLVVTPSDETILVDTGDWRQDGSEVIDYLESEGVDRIDHLVATHAHADHIGGHAAVIEHVETDGDGIGAAYDSGVPHTSQTYENYLDAVEEHDIELLVVEEGDELPIDDESVSALVTNPPEGDSGDDLHYNSVSLVLEFGEFRYVTTGDAEADAEDRIVEEWGDDLEGDVYQAGHHGSSTSSTAPFVDAVAPEIAVVSSDHDSQYGHPHDEVLEAFADRGVETYWTAVHGDVVVTTDGNEVAVETEAIVSTDGEDLREAKHAADDPHSSLSRTINTPLGLTSLPG
ncbi:ComEC/Rec2 family competence protein [Natronobacterium gregoryi]|nr:ComEC/Rec2 family competence protein [Natronobacterium gregoryi]AFZ74417.1 putative hydrolase (metallo-beta-lactamase superfamily) [Natronobacterium gregoryi SP2]PLK19774.1 MBL fold metallo-hydrolase [Natronobacterium gregoryi SP2]SFJ40543.1 competence protein ComEC [Natronobacterium gregoryi]